MLQLFPSNQEGKCVEERILGSRVLPRDAASPAAGAEPCLWHGCPALGAPWPVTSPMPCVAEPRTVIPAAPAFLWCGTSDRGALQGSAV